ncbi:MAG: Uma2 family endonuclease [Coleofasciculus chthonoplastes F3-SA18-01]|uniref:Uma2 family endonuclease n=1 Tax=Coleofasciculus chthonoplastes TaxID=64178 RepID=UPI0032F45EBE
MIRLPTQSNPPDSPRQTLPTMYDLPSDNPEDPGLPDEFHFFQPLLLLLTFQPTHWNWEEVFSACDLNLYYDVNHTHWYKRPDWFGVVGIPRLYEQRELRLSYVIWQEQISPFVVVELLSPGTEGEDLGRTVPQAGSPPSKWQVYEKILRVPYYVIFSRYTHELQIFHLVEGNYQRVNLTDNRLVIPELGLSLGLWSGRFREINGRWLRWMTPSGELIPTDNEQAILTEQRAIAAQEQALLAEQRAIAAEERAQQEAQLARLAEERAQQEAQLARLAQEQAIAAEERAQQLAQRLRELGIDPDNLGSF